MRSKADETLVIEVIQLYTGSLELNFEAKIASNFLKSP